MPLFLQAHLDLPRKILLALRKEPGRIDADDLRIQLGIPLRYTAVTAVQYFAVLIALVMLSFLYLSADLESFFPVRGNMFYYNKVAEFLGKPEDFISGAVAIHNAVWTLFTGALLKAVFGYMIWWILVSHFLFSLFSFYILQNQQ
jgi:Predicted transmembrane protein 161AB